MNTQARENLLIALQRDSAIPGEVITRAASLAPSSLDSAKRQVRVVATTEDPALVYDYSSGRIVLEVLLMNGARFEEQTPLLRDHSSYSITSIVGSFTDAAPVGDRLEGTITIGKGIDDTIEGIWKRIEQGHLRRVSVGYDYSRSDYETITAGETRSVAGRTFTAPSERDLRIVKNWRLRELSLVVIPADARAQLKAQQPQRGTDPADSANSNLNSDATHNQSQPGSSNLEDAMKRFLQFLHTAGLKASITNTEEALEWARSGNLSADQITELASLCKSDGIEFDAATATAKRETPATTGARSGTNAGSGERRVASGDNANEGTGEATNHADLAQRAVAEALANERTRVNAIRTLGTTHEIDSAVIETSVTRGDSLEQAQAAFLDAIRSSRQSGAPAVHVRSGLNGRSGIQVLQAALMLKNGIDPDTAVLNHRSAANLTNRRDLNIGWALHAGQRGARRDELESAFDQVRQRGLQNATMLRIAQELVELETGQRAPYNQDELIERAFTTANFSAIFGSVIHLMMWAGYASAPSTYQRFCEVMDVPDFKDNSEAMVGEVGRLKRQSKTAPGQAQLLNMTDPVLAKIAADRYAGMLKITEQTFINDQFGSLGQTPTKLGQSVQSLIDDLVWAQLMSLGNLSDGRTRFNTTDGNLVSSGGTLDVAGLTAMEVLLRNKKVGDRRIQLGRTVIVTGRTLGPRALVLSGQTQLTNEEKNPFAGTFEVVQDGVIDMGVNDPYTDPETVIAGRPNSYFALTSDGNSIKVAFRSGTNRGPVTRSKALDTGEWGLGWDVYVDVGAAFMRRTGAVEIRT